MKFLNWVKKLLIKFGEYIWGNSLAVLSLIATVLALLIAYLAYNTALESIENANAQRLVDMERSDAQFKLQMEGARSLNDSLIIQIESLQEITAEQLDVSSQMSEVIQKQLNILESALEAEQYAGRPKLHFQPTVITDSIFKENGRYFSPTIVTTYQNIGKRFAYELRYRAFVVYNQFTEVNMSKLISLTLEVLETNGSLAYEFKPTINAQFKDDFYYCYEITYFDKGLNRNFKQANYFHYYKSRGKYEFFLCSDEENDRIRMRLNEELEYLNRPLLNQ